MPFKKMFVQQAWRNAETGKTAYLDEISQRLAEPSIAYRKVFELPEN
ncbi:MAG: hypothetical protein JWQ23_4639 [Herminiimonas sp.]|jgi:hypothetical protein|nr:hypothetical protein [Herminiimonas sp.]